jgi:hypothetical protein
MKKYFIIILFFFSSCALAQYDSTNLPGLSTNKLTTPVSTTGSGVPNASALDAETTYTETEVEPCPSGYYPDGAVPTDGSDVNDENVTGGVIYDQSVTTDRYGTTTYGGWNEEDFLCTQIPPAPSCPTGETEVSAPYWNSATNQWVGIVCENPVTDATQLSACFSFTNLTLNSVNAKFTSASVNQLQYYNATGTGIFTSPSPVVGYGNSNGQINEENEFNSMLNANGGGYGTDEYTSSYNPPPKEALNVLTVYRGSIFDICYLQSGTNNVVGSSDWVINGSGRD